MVITRVQAFELLHKWRDERSTLRAEGNLTGFGFTFDGELEMPDDSGWLTLRQPDTDCFVSVFLPHDASFEYTPHDEVPLSARVGAVGRDPVLLVRFGADDSLTFDDERGRD